MNSIPPVVFGANRLSLLSHGHLKDLLQVLSSYADIQAHSEALDFRTRLSALLKESHQRGLWGLMALDMLERMIVEQECFVNMELSAFATLYRFVFFIGRDPGRKYLPIDRAIRAWEILLGGKFRLLEKFVEFLRITRKATVSEDTWRQVFDFSRQVHEDLSNYDPSSAWPVLLDEFVDHMCKERMRTRKRNEGPTCQMGDCRTNTFICSSTIRALPPTSGSKRRLWGVREITNDIPGLSTLNSHRDGDIKDRLKKLCIRQQDHEHESLSCTTEMEESTSSENMDVTIVEHDGSETSREDRFKETDETGYFASGESDGGIPGVRSTWIAG